MATTKSARGKGGSEKDTGATPDVDALFKLPLVEFTGARNALASQLKKAGRADDAERVKALAKPSVSAWVVNQLYWRHRDAFERLITAGERFRSAQTAQLSGTGGDLRETLEARRAALTALARLAASTLRDAGHSASPDTMRRITTTLEALSVYGSLAGAPPAGRLTDDVDPPGFETLAALVPRVGRSGKGDEPTRIIPFQQKPKKTRKATAADGVSREEERRERIAAAKAALKDADTTLRDARKTAQRAEAALKEAAAKAKDAEKEKLAAEQRLEKAAAAADEARQQARRVAGEAEEAAQAVADAERALENARRTLESI